jgi:hypothetical protein
LAALTGGELFVVPGTGSASAILAALASMRHRHVVQPVIDSPLVATTARMAGMDVTARWGDANPTGTAPAPIAEGAGSNPDDARYIGAVAAALAIPHMLEEEAAALAEAHGLVCHLTSLVLVDDSAEAQDGIPAHRKVPLMVSGEGRLSLRPAGRLELGRTVDAGSFRQSFSHGRSKVVSVEVRKMRMPVAAPAPSLKAWVSQVNWSDAEALRQGDISKLPPGAVPSVLAAAALPEVTELARALGVGPVIVVIALLAKAAADVEGNAVGLFGAVLDKASAHGDRNAARLFRAVLGNADTALVQAALRAAGL